MRKNISKKRNQKRYLMAAVMLWMILTARIMTSFRTDADTRVVSAFSYAVTDECEGVVTAYGRYPYGRVSEQTQRIILGSMADKIGINRYTTDYYTDTTGAKVTCLSQSSVNGDVCVRFVEKGEDECYIYTDILLYSGIDAVFTYEKIVRELYDGMEIAADVNVNLKGELYGQLSDENEEIYAKALLERAGAEYVTAVRLDDSYSVYGYDKSRDEYVNVGKSHVNVNVTISHDEDKSKTMVRLATPIVRQDF